MQNEVNRVNEMFTGAVRSMQQRVQMQQHQQNMMQQQLQHSQQHNMNMNMSPPRNDYLRPPMNQPPPSMIPQPQQTTPNLSAQRPHLNPPPSRRKAAGTPGAMQSPSPAPIAASTPPNASTPSAMVASPAQAPKSPKTKAKPKAPTAKQRRQSKAAANSPAAAGPSSAQSPDAAVSTPVPGHASVKRQREDDGAGVSPGPNGEMNGVANGPSPPKKAKMDSSSDGGKAGGSQQQKAAEVPTALVKKEDMSAEIAHIKTDEDASQFLDQMTELIKYAATSSTGTAAGEAQESLSNGLSETLEMLLKGCGPADGGDSGAFGLGDTMSSGSGLRDQSPPPVSSLFDEFFDFSNMPDEEDSKDTPDLVSSSTNPSPESNTSESDHHHMQHNRHLQQQQQPYGVGSGGAKPLDDISDVVRLGPWKEIDGGEAAYYQSNEWKWEGPMTTVDQPWAIFNQ